MFEEPSRLGVCVGWQGLESLVHALDSEARELRRERERALEARTLSGHAKNALGYCLSAFCVFK